MALLPVVGALAQVLAGVDALPAESIALAQGHRRVLAEGLAARRTQPPSDVSAMDGYAVRGADVARAGAVLKLVGEVAAGHPFEGEVHAGEAARIFTGGVMPPGADTVVIQENTQRDGASVTVTEAAKHGVNVRLAGLDFRDGELRLAEGTALSDRDLSLAAAMNHATLPVRRRPKVAMFATGDELVPPGQTPRHGEIVHSNSYALAALYGTAGAEVIDLGIVRDRLEDTVAAIRQARAASADILVTTGGASVGDYDLVQKALSDEGLALSFWKIAMRPGKPMMHGRLGATHVLGLPGNPVSSYVCSILFVLPLIRRMLGIDPCAPRREQARLGCDLKANDEREDYLRATLTDDGSGMPVATPFAQQDSSMLVPLAQAHCLAIRPPFAPPARRGDLCDIVKLPF